MTNRCTLHFTWIVYSNSTPASMLQDDEQVREQGHRFQGTFEKNEVQYVFLMNFLIHQWKIMEASSCRLFWNLNIQNVDAHMLGQLQWCKFDTCLEYTSSLFAFLPGLHAGTNVKASSCWIFILNECWYIICIICIILPRLRLGGWSVS